MGTRDVIGVLLLVPLSVFADLAPFPISMMPDRAIDVYLYAPMVVIVVVLGIVSTFALRNMRKKEAGDKRVTEKQGNS